MLLITNQLLGWSNVGSSSPLKLVNSTLKPLSEIVGMGVQNSDHRFVKWLC